MHLAVFVVRHGVLLQLFGHGLVVNDLHTAVGYQLDDVQQLACIAAAETQQRLVLLDLYAQ